MRLGKQHSYELQALYLSLTWCVPQMSSLYLIPLGTLFTTTAAVVGQRRKQPGVGVAPGQAVHAVLVLVVAGRLAVQLAARAHAARRHTLLRALRPARLRRAAGGQVRRVVQVDQGVGGRRGDELLVKGAELRAPHPMAVAAQLQQRLRPAQHAHVPHAQLAVVAAAHQPVLVAGGEAHVAHGHAVRAAHLARARHAAQVPHLHVVAARCRAQAGILCVQRPTPQLQQLACPPLPCQGHTLVTDGPFV
eukprot:CAMPEP_0202876398 /NCGR_PEP_ID=MMETSP1391-20130828/28924_1 /ASSEMBLY_ACC=CAM_ASM_000867 /TAXON_ID=1034604 /ORGANISM="Chlamydomonas leiostraca, Strain SAG 11-49" /LENGTH=247 /DNA_ID=CAMNT_0049558231 /DNA_START=159 /DNA_END=901 /DNA_ORIENTATION=-